MLNISNILRKSARKVRIMLEDAVRNSRDGMLPMNTTGSLINSIKGEVNESGFDITGADYGVVLDKGSSKVPFGKSVNVGGNSQYIAGLIKWGMRKFGWDYKTAKRKAFAIANTAKERGYIPGKKGWIEEIKDKLEQEAIREINAGVVQEVELLFKK